MDPTAPNNNQPSSGSTIPPNPIQPGQFVVAGGDQEPPQDSSPVAPQETQAPPPQPTVSLAGQRQESSESQMPTSPAASGASQPDPAPFAVEGVGQQSTSENKSGGSKKIIIVLAIVILLAIIGAVVYFFVLPQLKKNPANTKTSAETVVEEPSSPAPKTGSGFGDIPDSTISAGQTPVNPGALITPVPASATTNSPQSP